MAATRRVLLTTQDTREAETMAEAPAASQTIAGVERALDVLSLFGDDDVTDLGVTEVADRLDLSKSVVHRILSSLRVKGYVELDEDSRRYRLGPAILTLGLSYLDRLNVREVARDALRELVRRTDETATLSVRSNDHRVYVDQVTPSRDIKMVVQLGSAHPLHAGGSSKAMLAFLPEAERESYLTSQTLDAITPLTITSADDLRQELSAIRAQGYAVSLGERQAGAGSVAAPVFGHDGNVVGVISVCGPVERFTDEVESCARHLLEVTRDVSRRLGHRP
jgi:IclR family transcriptional regulator, acetate operon repressor